MRSDEPSEKEKRQRERARRHFERRRRAALAGLHLPTEQELLVGMPFLADDIEQDMQAFAERLLPRLRRKPDDTGVAGVASSLEQLTVSAGLDEVRTLADAIAVADVLPPQVRSWLLRCRIYRAHLGDHSAAMDLARDAVVMARKLEPLDSGSVEAAIAMIRAALGWMSFAACDQNFAYLGTGERLQSWWQPATLAKQSGKMLVELVEQRLLLAQADSMVAADQDQERSASEPAERRSSPEEKRNKPSVPAAIVFETVGNRNTGEGKKVAKELEELLGKPLPLVPVLDLVAVRASLHAEFPYAAEVVDPILWDISVRPHVQLHPTILVGAPGCGKTRFARRMLTFLNVPHDVIPCGGISDGTFAGTARRWSTGEPSLPVNLITRYRIAGPGAVLDEIEKVGSSRHNGQAHDALLAFLEKETACRFHDPYVQAPCDLSYVTWLMTANSLEGLSAALKDRCRVIQFPEPRSEDLSVVAQQIIVDILAEQGLDPRWACPLEPIEIEAIAKVWRGGSLRVLRRMIEVALATRNVKH